MPGPVPGPLDARAVERQLEIQQRIVRLAQTLLSLPAEELDQGIREQLAVAAELAGVERTRLIVANAKTGRVAAAYEWWSASERNVPPIEGDFFRRFAWAREQIQRGDVVQMSPDSLPREATAERDRVRSQGVRSVLVIPVRFGRAIVGGHIYASRTQKRIWSQQEIANLRVVTEIFASAIGRRQAEHALRESEQRFRAIAEHATELVSEFDHEGRYHYASPSFARHLDYDPAELLGKHANVLVHPEDLQSSTRAVARGVQQGVEVRVTHRMRHRDGTWRWFESSGGIYTTPNGSPRFVCIGRHVSERVAMEDALARQLEAEKHVAALSRRFLAVSAQQLDAAIRDALAEAGELGVKLGDLRRGARGGADALALADTGGGVDDRHDVDRGAGESVALLEALDLFCELGAHLGEAVHLGVGVGEIALCVVWDTRALASRHGLHRLHEGLDRGSLALLLLEPVDFLGELLLDVLDLLGELGVVLGELADLLVGVAELPAHSFRQAGSLAARRGAERVKERPEGDALSLSTERDQEDSPRDADHVEELRGEAREVLGDAAAENAQQNKGKGRAELPEVHGCGRLPSVGAGCGGSRSMEHTGRGGEPRSLEGQSARRRRRLPPRLVPEGSAVGAGGGRAAGAGFPRGGRLRRDDALALRCPLGRRLGDRRRRENLHLEISAGALGLLLGRGLGQGRRRLLGR